MKSEYPIIHDVEQGSEAWLKLRRGKFTGSEFYKLMKGGTRPMTDEEIEIAILQKNKLKNQGFSKKKRLTKAKLCSTLPLRKHVSLFRSNKRGLNILVP